MSLQTVYESDMESMYVPKRIKQEKRASSSSTDSNNSISSLASNSSTNSNSSLLGVKRLGARCSELFKGEALRLLIILFER